MAASSLIKKLRVQPGQRMLLLNAPEGYIESLGELPTGVELSQEPQGKFGFVHLFVWNSQELEQWLQTAMDAVEYDGLLWISYPKLSSKVETDLTRDVLWKLMNETPLRPVTQISIDQVWSALRFRPAESVGKN
jgi:hypothetical protein